MRPNPGWPSAPLVAAAAQKRTDAALHAPEGKPPYYWAAWIVWGVD